MTELDTLLARWRTTRDPQLADAIDAVGDRIAATLPPITGKTVGARLQAWLAVAAARDARDVGRLTVVAFPRTIDAIETVAQVLLDWPDDPRIAQHLVKLHEAPPVYANRYDALLQRVRTRVAELGDARVVARIRSLEVRLRTTRFERMWSPLFDEWVAAVEERVAALLIPLGEQERRQLETIASPHDEHAARLLEQIYASPHDRELVAVYGDYLAERADPRGELVALQLAPPTEDTARRERQLLAAHGARWAGTLGRYFDVEHRHFERGCFAGGRLVVVSPAEIDAILRDPASAMLRTLELTHANEDAAIPLLDGLDGIARVGPLRGVTARALATGAPRPGLVELHVVPDELDGIAECPALPNLETLALHGVLETPDMLAWLDRAAVLERIRRLYITTAGGGADAAATSAILQRLGARGGALREIHVRRRHDPVFDVPEWRLRLRRTTAPGPFDELVATPAPTGAPDLTALVYRLEPVRADALRSFILDDKRTLVARWGRERIDQFVRLGRHLEHVSLPWQPTVGASSPVLDVTIETSALPDGRLPVLWQALVAFDQRYETFTIAHNRTERRLGDKPLARLEKWLAKATRTFGLRGRFGEAARLDIASVQLDIVLGTRSLDDFGAWLATTLPAIAARHGSVRLRNASLAQSLGIGRFRGPRPGWIVVLGPPLLRFIDRGLVRAAIAREAALANATVTETVDQVIVQLCATPEAVRPPMIAAFEAVVRGQLQLGVRRVFGFDFAAEIQTAFAAFFRRHAFQLDVDAPLDVGFRSGAVQLTVSADVEPFSLHVGLYQRTGGYTADSRRTLANLLLAPESLRPTLASIAPQLDSLDGWVTATNARPRG